MRQLGYAWTEKICPVNIKKYKKQTKKTSEITLQLSQTWKQLFDRNDEFEAVPKTETSSLQ